MILSKGAFHFPTYNQLEPGPEAILPDGEVPVELWVNLICLSFSCTLLLSLSASSRRAARHNSRRCFLSSSSACCSASFLAIAAAFSSASFLSWKSFICARFSDLAAYRSLTLFKRSGIFGITLAASDELSSKSSLYAVSDTGEPSGQTIFSSWGDSLFTLASGTVGSRGSH